MRMFITIAALLLTACGSNEVQTPKASTARQLETVEVVADEAPLAAEYISPPTPELVNPVEVKLSPAARARMEKLEYTIPKDDVIVEKTVILIDSDSNVECQIPTRSMVTSEGNSDGGVYVSITPDHADPNHNAPVCAQTLSIMSRLGWAMAFLDLKEKPKS